MKIAILSYDSGKINRGVETWAENVKEHSNGEFQVSIIHPQKYHRNSSNWTINRLLILVDVIWSFRQWIQSDVIVPTNGTFQTLICRIASWTFRKPVVVFGHSGPGADDKWNLWCCPNVFVAFSTAQAAWANKFKLPWTKVVVIPHAVDTKMFSPSGTRKTVDVLCVAANHPNKRVDLVREAAKNLKLRIVGAGQSDQVPFKQMPQVYNQAKIFCFMPKSFEAFGLVYLEALACNLPVVAPNDPVRAEIVGDAGILIDDEKELTKGIDVALKAKWGDKPRQQALKFSWDKIVKLYTKLWQSL